MIRVQTSHDSCEPFKKRRIAEVLMEEADVKESEAWKIARSIERKIKKIAPETITTAEIREEVNSQLRKRGMIEEAKKHERVGIPVAEIKKTIGSHNRDNANVGRNPEAVHKYVADAALKQYALGCLPTDLARAHEKGDIHMHDLEFFPARPLNCCQHDLRYFIKHGLMVDGDGQHTSAAGPAKNIETLVNHAGQILMASQVFMSGGQSLPLMNVFMAPYVHGLTYERIKQAMQMLIFNLNMSYVSRGGQSLTYEAPLIIRDKNNIIRIVPIGEFVEKWDYKNCETLSLNRETGQYEWKTITNAVKHETASQLIKTITNDGRSVITTSDHSLFNFNERAEIIEVKPNEKLETILTAKKIPLWAEEPNHFQITEDEAFLVGICIGAGSLADSNMRIFLNKNEKQIQKLIKEIVDTDNQWEQEKEGSDTVKLTFVVKNPLLKKINRGSNNKKIPEELLSGDKGQVLSLLDGLICSDGNINRNRIEFNTTSEELANQIQFLLLRLGLEYNIKTRNSESNFKRNYPVFTIQVSASSSQSLRVTEDKKRPALSDSISQQGHDYSIIQPALNRPKRLPDGGVWEYRGQFTETNRLKYNGLEANSEYYPEIWNKVKGSLPMVVKEQKEAEHEPFVYDISVQDNENFVLANGIVAHNTVFSSVNLEFDVPSFLQDEPAWGPGGREVGTYGDYVDEAEKIRRTFTEVLLEGDSMGKPHLFPNTVYVLRGNEDEEALRQVHELSAKYSTPYFANCIPEWTGGHSDVMGSISYDTKLLHRIDGVIDIKPACEVLIPKAPKTEVMTFNDDGEFEWKPIEIIIEKPPSPLYKIRTEQGRTFEVTANHNIPVIKDGKVVKVKSENLNIGDELIQFTTETIVEESNNPKDILTGIFIADGYIRRTKNTTQIEFHIKKEWKKEIIKDLCDELNLDYKEKGNHLVIQNEALRNELVDCYDGKDKIIPPKYFSDVSKLSGIKTGLEFDSHRHSSGRMHFYTSSEKLASQFMLLLDLFGQHHSHYTSERNGWSKEYNISYNFKRPPKNIIKSIEVVENDKPVFDMQIKDNHNYVCGDGLVAIYNCRTRLNTNWTGDWDTDTLRTGNLAYVTINLPRLAYKGEILEGLQDILPIAEEVLLIRREQALKCMGPYGLQSFLTQKGQDNQPYYRIDNATLSFGFVGMHEMLVAMGIEDGILDPEGQKIATGVLEFMNAYARDLTEETGYRWTILQTPAESTAHRFAELDRQFYPNKAILNGEPGSNYYTNSTHVPVNSQANLFNKLRIEEQFHPLTSGGHITNLFLGEARPDVDVLTSLTQKIVQKTNTGFFAYSSAFSYCFYCNTHMRGLQEECFNCRNSETIEWYDRITGYIQAVGRKKNASGGWNAGKQNELADRRRYDV